MSSVAGNKKHVNHGYNLKRVRENLGIKQEALVTRLGSGWSQPKLSSLEGKEIIDASDLEEIAKALDVPVDAILNYDEERNIYNIQNNYEGANTVNHQSPFSQTGPHSTFNSLEKFEALIEENKKLYEQLLQAEREKSALLERALNERYKQ